MKYFAIYDGAAVVSFGSSSAAGTLSGEITRSEYEELSAKYAEAREYAAEYREDEIATEDIPEELRVMFPDMFADAPEPSDDDEIADSEALAIITEGVTQ